MRYLVLILMLGFSNLVSNFAMAQAYVEVSGQAVLKLPADYVQLSIGLDSHHNSAAKAARANAVQMAKLVDFLRQQQVADADMRTQQLNLQAQFDYQRQQVTGYTTSRTMQVKIRKLDRIDQLLVDLAELGGNRLHGYQAGVDNPDQWQHKLLQLASDNARHKASVLANSQQISEGNNIQPPRIEYARAAMAAEAVPASTQVGDINLRSQVRIRFALTAE